MNDSNQHDRIAKVNPFFIPANNHELFFYQQSQFLINSPQKRGRSYQFGQRRTNSSKIKDINVVNKG